MLNGQRALSAFLTPYQYSYFLFLFPMSVIFHFLSSFIPTNTIQISSINPVLVPTVPPGITLVPGLLFDFLMKLPLIASDTIIALLIYKMSNRYFSKERAVFATALWFLNPLTIWISSGWGMFDTLPALFTVLSLYFILEKKVRFIRNCICLGDCHEVLCNSLGFATGSDFMELRKETRIRDRRNNIHCNWLCSFLAFDW